VSLTTTTQLARAQQLRGRTLEMNMNMNCIRVRRDAYDV
jgi:hypothetical protein